MASSTCSTDALLRPEPTVVAFREFNAMEDSKALRAAMKGLGTNEQVIIDILTRRSNSQRQEISKSFTQEFNRDLVKDLKSELGGRFEDVILGLMSPPVEYLCQQLNKAMKGVGCDKMALIEILCTRTNKEIKDINDTYKKMYSLDLGDHISSETTGEFQRFLELVLTGLRYCRGRRGLSAEKTQDQVKDIYNTGCGEGKMDQKALVSLMAHESFEQLKRVFEEYESTHGHSIEQDINEEMSRPLRDAMLAVVQYADSPWTFYAKQLRKAVVGLGTNDTSLIRIIVSRCEIDLGNIKREYERLFNTTLESDVKGDTSGDYMKALVALIGSP